MSTLDTMTLQESKERKKERKTDRQKDRKKERKKERRGKTLSDSFLIAAVNQTDWLVPDKCISPRWVESLLTFQRPTSLESISISIVRPSIFSRQINQQLPSYLLLILLSPSFPLLPRPPLSPSQILLLNNQLPLAT